jgi:hypothetical protein
MSKNTDADSATPLDVLFMPTPLAALPEELSSSLRTLQAPADEGLLFAALEDLALLARSLGSSDSAFSDEYLRHVNIELGLEILILADRFAGRLHNYRKAAL